MWKNTPLNRTTLGNHDLLDTLGQSGVAREFVGVVGPAWDIQDGSGGTSSNHVNVEVFVAGD